jgi:chromosome segregation ATPase
MNLSKFVSLSEQIRILEDDNKKLKSEVSMLEKRNKELRCKCQKLSKPKSVSKGNAAIVEIERLKSEGFKGTIKDNVVTVAAKYGLSISWVFKMWWKN